MGVLDKTLDLPPQVGAQQRRLFVKLTLIGVITVGLALAVMLYYDYRTKDALSRSLIDSTAFAANGKLDEVRDSVESDLRIVSNQLKNVDVFSGEARDRLDRALPPVLMENDNVTAIIIADMKGNQYSVRKDGDGFVTSLFESRSEGGGTTEWQHWSDGAVSETGTRQTDYDPRTRPWFKAVQDAEDELIHWTSPYIFFTTKLPGVTVSEKWTSGLTGAAYITAFDVTLRRLSRFTTSLRPTENSMLMIMDDDLRVAGLPAHEKFAEAEAISRAVLVPAAELGIPAVNAAVERWEERERSQEMFRYINEGDAWWARFVTRGLNENRGLWAAVLIPEADLLAGLDGQRNLALAIVVGTGLSAAIVLVLFSVGAMRRSLQATVSQLERRLGQYRLKQKIGDGGNGSVYRAQHALLRRPTAIKLMHPEYARSESAKQRFEHEVQVTADLTHPNTVAIYDYGQSPDGTLYYVMEYLIGITLEDLVRLKGPQPPARVIHALRQAAGSLSEAHGKGLIHRDVKPSNIMLCERGGLYDVVKVLDFGLVKESEEVDPNVTQADALVGTPLYMAPEIIQAPGRAAPQSDIYALGAVGYYLLTGYHVFEGSSTVDICAKHLHEDPVPPSQRVAVTVPEDLEQLILGCLEKDPAARPESASVLQRALAGCADSKGWTFEAARDWWSEHKWSLPVGTDQQARTPLSNTELLIDLGERPDLFSSAPTTSERENSS